MKKEKMSQKISRELLKMIESGQISAGEKLPTEMELAAQFEVSRVPVREALSVLRAMGVITSQQGGGSYVEDIGAVSLFQHFQIQNADIEDIRHLFELRKILEPEAAYLAALRRTPEQLEEIQDALIWMKDEFISETKTGQEADFKFHYSMIQATQNPVMIHLLKSLSSLYKKGLAITLKQNIGLTRKRQTVYKEHESIFLAIKDEEPELAKVQCAIHLKNVEKKIFLSLDDAE